MADQGTLNRFVIGIQINGGDKLNKLLDAIKQVDSVSKKLGSTTKKGTKITKENASAVKNIGTTFFNTEKRINSFNKTMIASFRTQKNEIADVFRRVALWSGALGALFGTISKLKQVYSATLDLQVAMAELHKVMGDYKPYRKMKREIFEMAQQYSSSAQNAFDIAKIWAQQGKTMSDVIKLTGLALRGVNSANLTAAESVEFLTSVTKTYNLEASKTYSVLDGIMKVQANYAITAQNLAKGFMIAGKAAQIMGDDIGTVMGMITAIGQVTRETGNKIGTSLKTQFARLKSPAILQYLEGKGIHTRAENGEVVNIRTLFSQLSAKWKSGEIKPTELGNIARVIGGRRKFKDVLVLIDQWQVAEEARMKYLKAYGDAEKASAILQDTLRKKMERFNTILVNLGDNILEQSLIPAFSSLIDILNDVGSVLRNITESNIGGMGMSVMLGMGGIGALGAIKNKFAQGRITDMMRNIEMITAMRSSGVIDNNVVNTYENMFGLVKKQPLKFNIQPAAEKFQSSARENIQVQEKMVNSATTTYKTYLNNLEQMERAASKLGPEGQIIMRNATMQMVAQSAAASGMTRSNAFLRGLKYGLVGDTKIKGEERMVKTALFGKSVANFGKSVLRFGAISMVLEAIVWGITKIVQGFASRNPKINISSNISFESDISKDFVSLAKGLKDVQDAAVGANKTIDEYINSNPDVYKKLIEKIVKPVGEDLISGVLLDQQKAIAEYDKQGKIISYKIKKPLTTLEQLMASFKKHGLAVKNYNDALRAQMVIYKFIGNEILKQKQQLIKSYMDVKDKVVKDMVNASPLVYGIKKTTKVIGKGGFNTVVDTADIKDFTNKFSKNLSDKLTKIYDKEGFNFSKLFAYIFEKGKEKDKNTAIKMIDEAIWRTAQKVAGKPPEIGVTTSYKRTKTQTDKEYYRNIIEGEYRKVIVKNVTALAKTTEEYKKWKKLLNAYGKNLKNGIDVFIRSLYVFASGLIGAKDKVFDAFNQYDKDLKKIKISEQMFPITGLKKSFAQQRLVTYRKLMGNLVDIAPELEKRSNSIYNQFDRIVNILNNGVEGVNDREINQLKEAFNKGDKDKILEIADIVNSAIAQTQKEGAKETGISKEIQKFLDSAASIKAEKFVNYGKILQASKTFAKILKNKNLGLTEKDARVAEKMLSEGNISGFVKKMAKSKPLFNKLLAAALSEIIINSFKNLNIEFRSKQREIQAEFDLLFFEGTGLEKIKKSGMNKIKEIINSFNDKINRESDKLKNSPSDIDIKNIQSKIAELEARKQINVELEKQNTLLSIYQEQLSKIDSALDDFKQSTISFLSDINTYNFNDKQGFNQSMKSWLGSLSSTVLQNSISGLGESIFKGKGGRKLAAILLGEKLPKEPKLNIKEINTQEIAIKTNTKALNVNTAAILKQIKLRGGDISGITIPKQPNAINNNGVYGVDGQFHPIRSNKEDPSSWIDKKTKDIKFSKGYYFARGMGDIGGAIMGNLISSKSKRSNDMVGFGTMAGNALAALAFSGSSVAAFGLPLLVGGIAGLFGSKMKDNNKPVEDWLKKINDNNKKIVENTAPLKAVDSRIINAPSNFVLPALAKSGGNTQYINIQINGASDPQSTAEAVRKVFDDNYNFNNVSSNI